ncbi:UDP-N-acetylmuramoyl-tripeptide--D-alanyl-D-alanine ligase [Candidatus Uhrbacteria bacterium]|nr:UDP-N-acetylmuramoyl-tripeptide--D-alanyl-D-alanine ligase [Candidatus Uhrbacteria bacterium]
MSLLSGLQGWLGRAAAKTLSREGAMVIAVTGSVGKSTTKQAIAAVLQSEVSENRVRVPKNSFNNELGVPLTVFGHPAPGRNPAAWLSLLSDAWLMKMGLKQSGIRTFVFEMGADKPGDLAYLTSIAKPDIAVVTAITADDQSLVPVHAGNYPSLDALVEEKSQLVKALKPGGVAVLNADDKKVFAMRHLSHERSMTYGEADGTDVRIVSCKIVTQPTAHGNAPVGLEVKLENYQRSYQATIPGVYGRSAAYAYAAAVCVAEAMDIAPEQIAAFEKYFQPVNGRTRILPGIKQTYLFDDTYNASPASVIQSLKDLASVETAPGQRKIACLGEMRELGEKSEEMHRRVGAETAKAGIDVLVCCGIFGRAMMEGALANGMTPEQVRYIEDTPEAGLFIQEILKPGDIVLAKASQGTLETKGVRMERVIKELMAEPTRAGELLVRQGAAWQRK